MAQSPNVLTTNDAGFEKDVVNSSGLSIVDFWAEWCGPCKMLAPTLDSLADEYTGRVKVFKVNVDENPNTPAKFGVRGIPTIVFMKDGKLVDQLVGNHPKENFVEKIKTHLA